MKCVSLRSGLWMAMAGCLLAFSVWAIEVTAIEATAAEKDERPASSALAGLDVGEGLEATLFAAEPMLLSPTNIDIDHRGRIWVCEVVNYRNSRNHQPVREKGDRILILEDTDGDGTADKKSVFYQGRDIDSAHGVCVLGRTVIVSALDKVLVFTDSDGDDKADKKEVLFSGISGVQHDHGIHMVVFGPDGKLYFNFGNNGQQVKDKDGKPIIDLAGNEVIANRKPYQEGMVFRCNLDGSQFETLGWNFRNNWEIAVDSFGTLWQSDNDDDGNRGVRINFVMEFGNYGYKDEFTGAGWRTPRTGMHEEIPLRHWHLNDPGVVPNLLQTGAGSPTGLCIYEGSLLPRTFQNQPIHTDAGPNIVRAYPVTEYGAGYKATLVNMLEGSRDKWFRPSDVCVAPDGSLIIADWYDPGVGGHKMGDPQHGRLFRISPPKSPYWVPKHDFTTAETAANALKSPNIATRYLAWTALHEMGDNAEPALRKMYRSNNPRFRARALWLLAKLPKRGLTHAMIALDDKDPNIRITGLRAIRQMRDADIPVRKGKDIALRLGRADLLIVAIEKLVHDPSSQVRRECAIALRSLKTGDSMPHLWAKLAIQHDGEDRWYLEALGIGAGNRWEECLAAWLREVGDKWNTPAGRDIIWRSRTEKTPDYLARIILDDGVDAAELPRYLRALDFQTGPRKNPTLLQLAFANSRSDSKRVNFVAAEALARLDGFNIGEKPQYRKTLARVLDSMQGTSQFVELVGKFHVDDRYPQLLALAQEKPQEQIGVEAIRALLEKNQIQLITHALQHKDTKDAPIAVLTAKALGSSADGRVVGLLFPVMQNTARPIDLRREAVRGIAKTRNGAMRLVKLTRDKKLDTNLRAAVAASLHSAQWNDVKQQAAKLFPLPATKNNKPLPPLAQLLKTKGNVSKGKLVFNTTGTCVKCHVVNSIGKEVGPNLSEIGKKLSRQAMFDSVLFPSAGISHNYETYVVLLDSGNVVNGLMTSRTDDFISLKGTDAIVRTFKTEEVEEIKKQNISLMPADLQKVMTAEELIDVVEYMITLKQAKQAVGGK